MKEQLAHYSHKRFNILTDEWVLVSPHRSKRPWQGQQDEVLNGEKETYNSECYLCPGNQRSNGTKNPNYSSTFLFDNDFAALKSSDDSFRIENGLLKASSENGICKVICFSPDHSKSLAGMSVSAIEQVVSIWQQEYECLGEKDDINYIQIFENKGAIMGCSNPHPHGQIWAQNSIPDEVLKKEMNQKTYYDNHQSSLLGDYLKQELELEERIIFENNEFAVIVPFWAIWPFETMIVPKTPQPNIGLMNKAQKTAFSEAIKRLTTCYDKLFNCSFPYSAGIHQSPTNRKEHVYWHWHMSFYPPLLRSASVKKFMVGYELFAMPQRDITAEIAAEMLRMVLI